MYDSFLPQPRAAFRAALVTILSSMMTVCPGGVLPVSAQELQSASLVHKISGANDKLEITTNTSRILTLDKNIPRVQVNNPELLAVTPLSANQVQISAKKAGVTQVNLWDEDGTIHTVDVLIYGDVRELEVALQTQFPNSSIKVYRYSESLVLKGFVDQPDHVSQITQLASDYAPKVINNITVGGVQQVLLKVKVMEVSRTKLRRMATDFTILGSGGSFFSTGVSGLLQQTSNNVGGVQSVVDTAGKAAEFGIVNNGNAFFGFLDWLQENHVAKILAEPNIAAVSGRPAEFNVGGEIPIVVPQSLGTASIEFKKFGTQVDFLPIVLGNGNIRLEVRPRISEIDDTRSVVIQNFVIPSLTVREVDTAVEMKAGQTFALAGLVQQRTESQTRGLPYISDVPVLGLPFRKVEDNVNEIELLILVTPEFVDAIEPCDVPCGGPGYATVSPENHDLYCGAHLEVPAHCDPIRSIKTCNDDCGAGCGNSGCRGGQNGPAGSIITDGQMLPGGTGYQPSPVPTPVEPNEIKVSPAEPDVMTLPSPSSNTTPLPPQSSPQVQPLPATTPPQTGPSTSQPIDNPTYAPRQVSRSWSLPQFTQPRPYSPQRTPTFVRNASKPDNPNQADGDSQNQPSEGGLIGPVGYDAQ
jgi:pilus assembly protein CpaC